MKLEYIKRLDGNTFRLFAFLNAVADANGIIRGDVTWMQNELNIGSQTVYKALRILENEGMIERHGHKKYFKLLTRL